MYKFIVVSSISQWLIRISHHDFLLRKPEQNDNHLVVKMLVTIFIQIQHLMNRLSAFDMKAVK